MIEIGRNARISLYKFLSRAFDYPNERLVEIVSNSLFRNTLDEIVSILDPGLIETSTVLMEEAINEACQGLLALEIEYNRLFQLSHERPCPLTASEYIKGESRQATAVAQLQGLYRSFGLRTRPSREPDAIPVLLEFMAHLYASEERLRIVQDDRLREFGTARGIVIEDYLGFVPLLKQSIDMHASGCFYMWSSTLLVGLVGNERKELSLACK